MKDKNQVGKIDDLHKLEELLEPSGESLGESRKEVSGLINSILAKIKGKNNNDRKSKVERARMKIYTDIYGLHKIKGSDYLEILLGDNIGKRFPVIKNVDIKNIDSTEGKTLFKSYGISVFERGSILNYLGKEEITDDHGKKIDKHKIIYCCLGGKEIELLVSTNTCESIFKQCLGSVGHKKMVSVSI